MYRLSTIIDLLEKQLNGNKDSINEMFEYLSVNFPHDNNDWDDHTRQIINITLRWKGMFSFQPGIIDGLDAIHKLAVNCNNNQYKDLIQMFRSNEWKKLVSFTGPAEAVHIERRNSDGFEFVSIGMSGFLDMIADVCDSCGNVCYSSIFNKQPLPKCTCGGEYRRYPYFGSRGETTFVKEISPYEYFYTHNYIIIG